MSTASRDNGTRYTTIRLSDVPHSIRQRAARRLIAKTTDIFEAIELRSAADHPSDTEYVLTTEAVRRVLG